MTAALEIDGLHAAFRDGTGWRDILRGVCLRIAPGEAYGLVGESGCGKSTAALAVLRALPRGVVQRGGTVRIAGQDVGALGPAALRHLRATSVSMVYQDAARALNPSLTIARQLTEPYELLGQTRSSAREAAAAMLARTRIPDPARVLAAYPHQLSGGMQQRVIIAMALAKSPRLLVLDEPTTGLDATVEAEILDLLADLRSDTGVALLFISHNLGIVRALCDRVGILYAGTLVEEGPARDLLASPAHPYAVQLLRCLPAGQTKREARLATIPGGLPPPGPLPPGCIFTPRCPLAADICHMPPAATGPAGHWALCHFAGHPVPRAEPAPPPAPGPVAAPLLDARDLSMTYTGTQALRGVTLAIAAGETLGLVGESGSGKTTLARLLLGLAAPDPGGTLTLDGHPLAPRARSRSRADRKAMQIIFQNPDSALNRAHTVRQLIARPLARLAGLRGPALGARLHALLSAVRLDPSHLAQRPRQLSGGLKQRVAIARAFAGDPRLVVCDEPTSALDVSVQAQILNLLAGLQAERATAYLFISHDLAVVRFIADRIGVLYRGRLMELGPAAAVFAGPHHPYTAALLAAAPGQHGPRLRAADTTPARGCLFGPRCPRHLGPVCDEQEPAFVPTDGHAIRCHIPRGQLGRDSDPG